MGKISKQLAIFTALAVSITFGAVSVSAASGTDIVWKRVQIPWAFKAAGTLFTGAAKDTAYLTDEADSLHTDIVSTGDWAWDYLTTGPGAVSALPIAFLTVTAEVNNGAADSLYFSIEQGRGSKLNYNGPLTAAAAIGNYVMKLGTAASTRIVFIGPIMADLDFTTATNLEKLQPGSDFRLVFRGDQNGTTPKLSQCRVYLTYPSRRASQ